MFQVRLATTQAYWLVTLSLFPSEPFMDVVRKDWRHCIGWRAWPACTILRCTINVFTVPATNLLFAYDKLFESFDYGHSLVESTHFQKLRSFPAACSLPLSSSRKDSLVASASRHKRCQGFNLCRVPGRLTVSNFHCSNIKIQTSICYTPSSSTRSSTRDNLRTFALHLRCHRITIPACAQRFLNF